MRIHDIPWLVLLPQLEKLTYALETHLGDTSLSMPMRTLIEARDIMGDKMLPLRDAILESWDFTKHYLRFVRGTSHKGNLSEPVKRTYDFIVRKTTEKIEGARQALFEFREELENIVGRLTSMVGGGELAHFTYCHRLTHLPFRQQQSLSVCC
jgi:hypothetical protein